MMTVPSRVLLQDLQDKTEMVIQQAISFKDLPIEKLFVAATNGGWSIAECLQHLNYYGHYYLPKIKAGMTNNNLWQSYDTIYKSTWIGNYFVQQMLPKQTGDIKKLKTPNNKNPKKNNIPNTIIDLFIEQQQEYKSILFDADKYNLNKIKIAISIAPFIRINLGDTLRFCVHHNIRHINQATRVLTN
jgi:hypothetical protein